MYRPISLFPNLILILEVVRRRVLGEVAVRVNPELWDSTFGWELAHRQMRHFFGRSKRPFSEGLVRLTRHPSRAQMCLSNQPLQAES